MSTSVGTSDCCLSSKVHKATPTGSIETVGSLQTYIAAPNDGSKAKSVVFIPDVFGWELPNIRLLADDYAKAGLYCYIPDIHHGDSLPIEFLSSMEPPLKTRDQLSLIDKTKNTATVSTTLPPWLVKHRQSVSKPIIDSFISTVRAIPGTQKVGTVGFSWGGRYAILAAYGDVDAAYACHPSPLNVPEDLRPVSKPLSLALGDKDSFLDRNAMGQIQDALAVKTDVPHELRIYEDQIHGFTLRDDWSGDKDRKAMDEAEMQGIEWFCRYLS